MNNEAKNADTSSSTAAGGRSEAALLCADLEKIDQFPVGRPFSTKANDGPVRFGWITGYSISRSGELVFRCRLAHRDGELLLHPSSVHSVLTDWNA